MLSAPGTRIASRWLIAFQLFKHSRDLQNGSQSVCRSTCAGAPGATDSSTARPKAPRGNYTFLSHSLKDIGHYIMADPQDGGGADLVLTVLQPSLGFEGPNQRKLPQMREPLISRASKGRLKGAILPPLPWGKGLPMSFSKDLFLLPCTGLCTSLVLKAVET